MNKEPICYKNSENPSCIDFILTSCIDFISLFTGLSDFYKLVLSVFKTTFSKSKPKDITYRNFKNSEEESFSQELKSNLINNSTESYEETFSFFRNLNPSNICDNKTCWKYIQLFFSEKRKISNEITLVDDNDVIVSDDQSISEELNTCYKNATKSLNIRQNSYLTDESNEIEDQVKKAIFKYKNHPSIILIKNKITVPELFAFTEASVSDIEKELSNLNAKKASTFKNITPKVLKASIESCSEVLTKLFNSTILTSNFPD